MTRHQELAELLARRLKLERSRKLHGGVMVDHFLAMVDRRLAAFACTWLIGPAPYQPCPNLGSHLVTFKHHQPLSQPAPYLTCKEHLELYTGAKLVIEEP